MLSFLKQKYTQASHVKDIILPNSFTSFYGADFRVGAMKVDETDK